MFWPVIDDALRRAAIERGVEVKLLLSNWTSTRPQMRDYLKSLTDLSRCISNNAKCDTYSYIQFESL